jgi:heme exporter protein A
MLTVDNLTCERNSQILFENLSFRLQAGEVLHLRGANGVGKTSLLRVLCGLMPATEGSLRWCGQPLQRVLAQYYAQTCYVGHQNGVKSSLTVRENLSLYAALNNCAADLIVPALESLRLYVLQDRLCHALSAGQRRRVALARLALTAAKLWLLDEPLVGLDQQGIAWLGAKMREHCQQQGMVLITSHQPLVFDDLNMKIMELSHV